MNPTRNLAAVLTLAVLAGTSLAGWEDTGVARQPAARPASRPAPRTAQATVRQPYQPRPQQAPARYSAPAAQPRAVQADSPVPPRGSASTMPSDLYSAFLDTSDESDAWYRLSLVSSGDVEGLEDGFGLYVADGHFSLYEGRDILAGDLFIKLDPSLAILSDDAGLTFMPSVLMAIPFDFAWIWRYLNGWSLELGATPGLYADAKGLFQTEALGLPFRGCFYYALASDTAVRAGVEIRPGWDLVAMPLVGVAWQPSDMFIAEIGLPRTLAEVQIGPVGIYGKIQWNNVTYALDDHNENPKSFTLNGWQFGAGVSVAFTETVRLAFEAGVITGRDITFEDEGDLELDVDSAPYFSILFGSEF